MPYYDFDGHVIDQSTFMDLFERPERLVKQGVLPNGRFISTLWLGTDHSGDNDPPLIYQTMVFPSITSVEELDVRRYATRKDALSGHEDLAVLWSEHDSDSRSRHPTRP